MKVSVILTILIAAAGLAIGSHQAAQLATSRATHSQLVAEAARLGLTLDASRPGAPVRVTKREREDRAATAMRAAAEFIAFAREMEAVQSSGKLPDEARQKRGMDLMNRLMSLDATQLKLVIAAIRDAADLKDETRQGLVGFALMTFAGDHPQAALAMFGESSDLLKGGMGMNVISTSLTRWAQDDPLAALDWVRTNAPKYPELITDNAKSGLLTGAAIQDPKLAFKLIGELDFKDANTANNAIQRILATVNTPEARTAMLAALHDHLATLTDDPARAETARRGLNSLVQGAIQDGFAAATQWIASSKVTPAELVTIAEGINLQPSNSADTGHWVEWIGSTLPPEKSNQKIFHLVSMWTRNDYQAAGNWLTATPEGPSKNSAVRAYAQTVAAYEPEVAAQWALTLPAGKDRDDTLRTIYHNWPKGDPAAAAAFAKQHGIK